MKLKKRSGSCNFTSNVEREEQSHQKIRLEDRSFVEKLARFKFMEGGNSNCETSQPISLRIVGTVLENKSRVQKSGAVTSDKICTRRPNKSAS